MVQLVTAKQNRLSHWLLLLTARHDVLPYKFLFSMPWLVFLLTGLVTADDSS